MDSIPNSTTKILQASQTKENTEKINFPMATGIIFLENPKINVQKKTHSSSRDVQQFIFLIFFDIHMDGNTSRITVSLRRVSPFCYWQNSKYIFKVSGIFNFFPNKNYKRSRLLELLMFWRIFSFHTVIIHISVQSGETAELVFSRQKNAQKTLYLSRYSKNSEFVMGS